MVAEYQQLLNPHTLDSIQGLELLARIVVEGQRWGGNQSRRVGVGQEFSQYRAYEPGDDLRLLDWKMYARSDRYYIRQSEIDTNLTVKFILDNSASMLYKEQGLSKFQWARALVASLGYLAQKQGDAFGLFGINEEGVVALHPKQHQGHFSRFLHELVQLSPEGKWPAKTAWQQHMRRGHEKELIIFLSDFYDHEQEFSQLIPQLKTKKNEVLLIHITGEQEANLDFGSVVTFRDLETGKEVQVNTKEAHQTYQSRWIAFTQSIQNDALKAGIGYQNFTMNTPLEVTLTQFLTHRMRLL